MNIFKQRICSSALGFFIVLLSAPFSSADDTEIFFSNASSSSIKPNVLFVMDTSGSMTNTDGTGITRLDRMKSALSDIIKDATNMNIGIMRFIRTGGAVIYPVRDIDQVTSSTSIGEVTTRIGSSADDAEENATTHSVTLDNQVISLTTAVSASGGTIEKRVAQQSDDAEERVSNGSVGLTSSDLELMTDGSLQLVGVRFADLSIPTGATILSAKIEFTIDDHGGEENDDISILISAEQEDTGTFSNSSPFKVSDRTKTVKSVRWDITENSPPVGGLLDTPDLTDVVQEVVSHANWNSTSDGITFIIEYISGSGQRTVDSYSDDENAAKLVVNYQLGAAATTTNQLVGLRFQEVEIPQGVTITDARIDFTAAVASSGSASYTIAGVTEDDATPFTAASSNLSARSKTTSVNWPGAEDWTAAGEVYSTPDLSSIVQDIVNRSGWCGGNSISFIIQNSGTNIGTRFAKSSDDNSTESPTLRVSYDPATIPSTSPGGCIVKNYVISVNSSSNDAEESASGGMSLTSSDLEMVNDGNNQKIGIRFEDVNIPNAALVSAAYIEFHADGSESGSTTLAIRGHDVDSANIFTSSNNNISSRTTTSEVVNWASVPSWTDGETYTSPDLQRIVQEIVNRSGWDAGNDMAFIITGSGRRRADSYNENPALAPKLIIKAKTYGTPVSTDKTVRDELLDAVDDMYNSSGTPIVDAFYEAALYYRGAAVDKGRTRGTNSSGTRRYDRASHPGSYTAGTHNYPAGCTTDDLNSSACIDESINGSPIYVSPIEEQCQTNNIILLSDGQASQNDSASKVRTLTGDSSCVDSGNDACGPELARFLYETDQSTASTGNQIVKTFTIGFNNGDPYLETISAAGGGAHYLSSSASELLANFKDILETALDVDTSFVSPGVTVNTFNRLNHRDELYFSLFTPNTHPNWLGNLKRYRLDVSGDIYDNSTPSIVATDTDTGFFNDSAKSWWSSVVDGNAVENGGAAENLPTPALRKIYTHYSGASTNLISGANAFTVANKSNISKARLGIESETDTYHENLINWARGVDVKDEDKDGNFSEARNALADPLHSIPHLVTYGGTDESPDITIYYGDNQGFIHAINGTTGVEQFAFIPEVLLPNLKTFYDNFESTDHPYGMDGAVTSWVNDVDKDGQIELADSDHVYLYAGMRRGGRNYYALNVSDRTAPTLLWSITGGTGSFAELGQTWSRPVVTKVKINNTVRNVLIFAGGYDEDQDDYSIRTADNMGRAIYMIDASTGSLIWSGGYNNSFTKEFADMQYSIPSDIRVIDINGDGFADQMYVGDMGGQIWRFDITNGNNTNDLIDGSVIADFGGALAADNRRFYHTPDVSVLRDGIKKSLIIAIGSGFQAHPLNKTIDDRFYVIKDPNVFEKPASYTKLTESNLYDATDNDLGDVVSGGNTQSDQDTAIAALAAASGWFIRLPNNEKVLAVSTTVSNEIFFTTYEPTSSTSGCTVSAGTPWLYRVHSNDATPVINYDEIGQDNELTSNDRKHTLNTPALPPSPQRLRIDGQDILCVGTECETIEGLDTVIKTYWVEED